MRFLLLSILLHTLLYACFSRTVVPPKIEGSQATTFVRVFLSGAESTKSPHAQAHSGKHDHHHPHLVKERIADQGPSNTFSSSQLAPSNDVYLTTEGPLSARYPTDARRRELEGTVRLLLQFNDEGSGALRATRATVIQSAGDLLDQAAREAALRAIFIDTRGDAVTREKRTRSLLIEFDFSLRR